MASKPSNVRSKLTLIAIVVVAILPIAAGTLLYLGGWKPAAQINNGELIAPPRPVTEIPLQTLAGKPVDFKTLHGKWGMVYIDASACPDACPQTLHAIRQIHTSQGKEASRIKRVFIATGEANAQALQAQAKLYPDMEIWLADATAMPQLTKIFELDGKHRIYLVDPLGNVMMQYAVPADPAGIRKDMTRLLSYSWTG